MTKQINDLQFYLHNLKTDVGNILAEHNISGETVREILEKMEQKNKLYQAKIEETYEAETA